MNQPHVVIIGGGFAGLAAAKELRWAQVDVTLVDKRNHHLFQPLLYQVASAALSATDIAAPIRKVLSSQKNCTVLMADVATIDRSAKTLTMQNGDKLNYDYLVVACGMTNSYFGNEQWEEHAPGLKSLSDALSIRRRVLTAFEHAERTTGEEQANYLNFVVVGGGPTGVEMAGALSEIARRTMTTNFRRFNPSDANVHLIEGGSELLAGLPSSELRLKARRQLEELGVKVKLGTRVTAIDENGISLDDDTRIEAKTVIWAAGVKAEKIAGSIGSETDRSGRVVVSANLHLANDDSVYVIGDAAIVPWGDSTVPGLAPAASQMGGHAALNIKRSIRESELKPFVYLDKGQMATIGRSRAVAMSGPFKLSGWIAWLAWLFIHVLFLIDFRNRIAVILEWTWAYATFQRSARVILEAPESRNTVGRNEDIDH